MEKIHILMIDDDPMIQRLFGGQFSKRGVEMLYAHDGGEGREAARRLTPDLILLDYRLPGETGIEVLRRLKSEEQTKHIPIVMLTNEDIPIEGQNHIKEFGAEAYFHKGVDFHEFYAKLAEILKAGGKELPPDTKPTALPATS